MRKVLPFISILLILTMVPLIGARAGSIFSSMQISTDPYTNTSSQHQTQVEPDTFAFGSTIVATFQSGRFYDGGASNNGWATSKDGGLIWAYGFLPSTTVNSTPPGEWDRLTDPSVAYDPKHNVWIINSLAMHNSGGNDVIASRSTDGGLTWQAPVLVSSGTGAYYDKNWIGCDTRSSSPYYGNCYVEWDDANLGMKIYMSTSTDGGLTWSPRTSPAGSYYGLGGQILVQPNGTVVVPYSDGGSKIMVFTSTNGGVSWNTPRTISTQTSHSVHGNLRASVFLPTAEMNTAGIIYVVWPDCRYRTACSSNDLVMSISLNGILWSLPTRIPIDLTTSTVDHFLPGIAATGSFSSLAGGPKLAITYYYYPNANCTVATCQLNVGFISSNNGGKSWSEPETLAGPMTLSWIANTSQGYMVGDYISTSFIGSTAIGVFSAATAPIGSLYQQSSWAGFMPVTNAQSYPLITMNDPILSTTGDPINIGTPLRIP